MPLAYTIVARHKGPCAFCLDLIFPGNLIAGHRGQWGHEKCVERELEIEAEIPEQVEGTCRECGCTHDRACIRRSRVAAVGLEFCRWVEPGLCSACAPGAGKNWIHPEPVPTEGAQAA